MQDIKKQCDNCKTQETIKKTIADPNPETTIKPVKVSGRGKKITPWNLDLCLPCHTTLSTLITQWIHPTRPLDEFLPPADTTPEDPSS